MIRPFRDINRNLFSTLWITFQIILISLIYLEMDKKNLIKIDSVVKYKDVFTQVDNVSKQIRVQQGEKINMPHAGLLHSTTK